MTRDFKESLTGLFQIKQRNFVFGGGRIIKCFDLFFSRNVQLKNYISKYDLKTYHIYISKTELKSCQNLIITFI